MHLNLNYKCSSSIELIELKGNRINTIKFCMIKISMRQALELIFREIFLAGLKEEIFCVFLFAFHSFIHFFFVLFECVRFFFLLILSIPIIICRENEK